MMPSRFTPDCEAAVMNVSTSFADMPFRLMPVSILRCALLDAFGWKRMADAQALIPSMDDRTGVAEAAAAALASLGCRDPSRRMEQVAPLALRV